MPKPMKVLSLCHDIISCFVILFTMQTRNVYLWVNKGEPVRTQPHLLVLCTATKHPQINLLNHFQAWELGHRIRSQNNKRYTLVSTVFSINSFFISRFVVSTSSSQALSFPAILELSGSLSITVLICYCVDRG